MIFVERPISAIFLVLSVLLVIWVVMGARTPKTETKET